MISCSQCDYVVTSRSRFTQHHCAHCHLIVENRTQLNQHLKVNIKLFMFIASLFSYKYHYIFEFHLLVDMFLFAFILFILSFYSLISCPVFQFGSRSVFTI